MTSIDAASNRVFVGPPDRLLCSRVEVSGWNGVSEDAPPPGASLRGSAKVRRNHPAAPATARGLGGGRVLVEFDEPVRAAAPGQALVLYDDDDWVLGGGWIAAAVR